MEQINEKKRNKLKNIILSVFVILSLGFITKLENFKMQKEKPINIEYDDKGYIKRVENNGKVFKFKRGKLL